MKTLLSILILAATVTVQAQGVKDSDLPATSALNGTERIRLLQTNNSTNRNVIAPVASVLVTGWTTNANVVVTNLGFIPGTSYSWNWESNLLSAASNNTLTLTGAEIYTNGKSGSAFYFTSSNSLAATNLMPSSSSAKTFSVWFKYAIGANPVDSQGIFSYGASGAGNSFELLLNDGSVHNFWAGNGSTFITFGNSGLFDNNWHLATVVFTNGTMNCYTDSVLSASGTSSQTISTANNLNMGVRLYGSGFYKGGLDEANVFNRALTTNEVVSLFNSPTNKISSYTTNTTLVTNTGVLNLPPGAFGAGSGGVTSVNGNSGVVTVTPGVTNISNFGNGAVRSTAVASAGNISNPGMEQEWTDFIDNFTFGGLNSDNVSNGSKAGSWILNGYATATYGNLGGYHIYNSRYGGDNRSEVWRPKDPLGNGSDGGGYFLFEGRYSPSAPDRDGIYANYLQHDQYGNVGIGHLGLASDDTSSNNKNPDAKVTVYGTQNYPAFNVHTNGYGSGSGFKVDKLGQATSPIGLGIGGTQTAAVSNDFVVAYGTLGTTTNYLLRVINGSLVSYWTTTGATINSKQLAP